MDRENYTFLKSQKGWKHGLVRRVHVDFDTDLDQNDSTITMNSHVQYLRECISDRKARLFPRSSYLNTTFISYVNYISEKDRDSC